MCLLTVCPSVTRIFQNSFALVWMKICRRVQHVWEEVIDFAGRYHMHAPKGP